MPATGPCGRCGENPARGYARVEDTWYCHSDDQRPSCYELALWNGATPLSKWFPDFATNDVYGHDVEATDHDIETADGVFGAFNPRNSVPSTRSEDTASGNESDQTN